MYLYWNLGVVKSYTYKNIKKVLTKVLNYSITLITGTKTLTGGWRMNMNKVVYVKKITLEQLNKLKDLGYTVIVVWMSIMLHTPSMELI